MQSAASRTQREVARLQRLVLSQTESKSKESFVKKDFFAVFDAILSIVPFERRVARRFRANARQALKPLTLAKNQKKNAQRGKKKLCGFPKYLTMRLVTDGVRLLCALKARRVAAPTLLFTPRG